jgi:protein-S-isoprenylcysteine O-methyltransferase Ste14
LHRVNLPQTRVGAKSSLKTVDGGLSPIYLSGMKPEQSEKAPHVMSCPPVIFFVAWGAGLLLDRFAPLCPYASESWKVVGGILSFAGVAIGFWGVRTLRRAGTTVRPDRPVRVLVTHGPFRYSRNPLYGALTMVYVGVTLSAGALWPLATLVPVLAVVRWRIVRREEQYLEERFGDQYRAYQARVHRWI